MIINDVEEERVHRILQQQISRKLRREKKKNPIKIDGWNKQSHEREKERPKKGQQTHKAHTAPLGNQRRERVSPSRARKLSHAHPPLTSLACNREILK